MNQTLQLPPPEGPEYRPCACGHIEPEHDINGRWCAMDNCPCHLYRPDAAASAVVSPPPSRAALRDRIRRALCEADGFGFAWGTDMLEPDEYGDVADAVLAVLTDQRATAAEPPLSPDYQHPECGFHWHGRDGMDIPMRDGQPVCPRCELRRVEKLLDHRERRCEELRAESKRRGKVKLEYAEKNRLLEREIDEVRRQLGAEILRTSQAEAELRRMAAGAQQPATEAPVIAYRSPGTRALYCVICARQETGWQPVSDAAEQAACDFCGGRVHAVAARTLGGVVARYLHAPPAPVAQQPAFSCAAPPCRHPHSIECGNGCQAAEQQPAADDGEETRVVPCSLAILKRQHGLHRWEPQPGMDGMRCPGYSAKEA